MNHAEWVKKELKALSKSLGFRYTPREEIEDRLIRLREIMKKEEMESFLAVKKMDF